MSLKMKCLTDDQVISYIHTWESINLSSYTGLTENPGENSDTQQKKVTSVLQWTQNITANVEVQNINVHTL